ncbi:MAG: chorismate lyase [Gammaproteobacteria bacterium]|jgi:chorismate--pyruvate lyase|nr:chorismate lyase [Gammaproteobacteria bacterium]
MLNLGREPRWRPIGRAGRSLPPDLACWLTATESLTQRLQRICARDFAVELLGQAWCRPLPGERVALGMQQRAWALVRQVYLCCGTRPLVYARTVIPRATLRGRRRRYGWLGERPLGEVLFAAADVERSPLEVAMLTPDDYLHRAATRGTRPGDAVFWARRSVLRVEGYPLLVSEIFMPAIATIGRNPG